MIHFIVNPSSRSGRGIRLWEALKEKLDEAFIPYDCYFTRSCSETAAYTASVTAFGQNDAEPSLAGAGFFHHIAILGGDGTVNEVLNGIIDRKHTCISYFPTGSGNDLARSIGLRANAKNAFSHLTGSPRPMTVDIGRMSGTDQNGTAVSHLFVISSGMGFDAAVCARSLGGRAKKLLNRLGLGKLTYLINALVCLFETKDSSCSISLDDQTFISRPSLFFCVAMIERFEGGGFPFCPAANAQDGLFDICLVSGLKKRQVAYLLPMALFGKHTFAREVELFRAGKLEITASSPLYVHTDGEVPGKFLHITIDQPEQPHITFLV